MRLRRGHLTEEEKVEIVRLRREERMSSCEIAEKVNSNTTTICALIKPFPLTAEEMKQRKAKTAVHMRAALQRRGNYVNGAIWSPEEDAVLRKVWPTREQAKVRAALPNRSWATIQKRASEMGLRRSRAANTSTKGRARIDKFFVTLREIREARGMTREELAERMGIHRIMLAQYELGWGKPGWLRVRDWITALGYDIQPHPIDATEKKRGSRTWLIDEENILRELLAQGSTIPEASLALKRPPVEVEKRALTLGILEPEATRNVSGMTKRRLGT